MAWNGDPGCPGRRGRAAALLSDHDQQLARFARDLPAALWEESSLCAGWTNREVLAHLVAGMGSSARDAIVGLWRAGGGFHRANHQLAVDVAAARSPLELCRTFEELRQGYRGVGRLLPPAVLLADHVTHHLDIALAVGAPVDVDDAAARMVLGLTRIPNAFVPAARLGRGLDLSAPDVGWRRPGDLLVEGEAMHLISVLAGRPHALDRLGGPGVSILRQRLGAASARTEAFR